jgi:hypothetical protein
MLRGGRGLGLAALVAAVGVGCGSSSSGDGSGQGAAGPVGSSGTPAAATPTKATGEVGEWQTLEPLPTPRANHCSVAVNGYLVVIGGNYKPKGASSFVDLDDVEVAKIEDDGTLGPWKLAGHAPSALNSCTAATDGKDVFLVDAIFANDALGKVVRRATLSPDGALGEWQDMSALPDGVRVLYSVATVSSGALRAFRAKLPAEGDAVTLLRAPVDAPTWQESSILTGFRGHPQYAITDSFVYALGGYGGGADNGVLADGAGAPLDASGTPGAPVKVAPMPKPTSFGQAVVVDDWLFVVGGKDDVFAGAGRADVFAAQIAADGSVASWATKAPLPEGRTSHSLVRAGDFLYVTGGGYDAGGLATVFGARVRFAP